MAMPARLGAPAGSHRELRPGPARNWRQEGQRAATVGRRGGAVAARGSHSGLGLSQPPALGPGGHEDGRGQTAASSSSTLKIRTSRHGHFVTVQHTDTCKCWGAVLISSLHNPSPGRPGSLCVCHMSGPSPCTQLSVIPDVSE